MKQAAEASRAHYANPEKVMKKWLTEYKKIADGNDVGSFVNNKEIIIELYKLLEAVVNGKLDDFEKQALRGEDTVNDDHVSRHYVYQGRAISFWEPKDFTTRYNALKRTMIYPELRDLNLDEVRFFRNCASHNTNTISVASIGNDLNAEKTRQYADLIGEILVALGALDKDCRHPDFEMLRIREGDLLRRDMYKIGKCIGEGGMSRVYEATQTSLNRKLAVKEIDPGKCPAREVTASECDALKALKHPNIPTVYDTFSERSTYYVVMEYINGEKLGEYCSRRRPADTDVLRILIKISEVLQYLHGKGVVFCDLKPDNVIIDADGNPNLIDFGISKTTGAEEAVRGYSLSYAAPELKAGATPSPASDIYALGMVIASVCPENTPLREKVAGVIAGCTAYAPGERYMSAGEVRQALAQIAYAHTAAPQPKNRSTATLFIVFGLLLAALITGLVVATLTRDTDPGETVVPGSSVSAPGSSDGSDSVYADADDICYISEGSGSVTYRADGKYTFSFALCKSDSYEKGVIPEGTELSIRFNVVIDGKTATTAFTYTLPADMRENWNNDDSRPRVSLAALSLGWETGRTVTVESAEIFRVKIPD